MLLAAGQDLVLRIASLIWPTAKATADSHCLGKVPRCCHQVVTCSNKQGLQCSLGAAMPHGECLAGDCPGCRLAQRCYTGLSGLCQIHTCHMHQMQQQNIALPSQVKCSMLSGPSVKGSFNAEAVQPDPTQKLNARGHLLSIVRIHTAVNLLPEGLGLRLC